MITLGSWQSTTIIAVVATLLWGGAIGWYLIGNQRIREWWDAARQRLRAKPREE